MCKDEMHYYGKYASLIRLFLQGLVAVQPTVMHALGQTNTHMYTLMLHTHSAPPSFHAVACSTNVTPSLF